MMASVDFMLRCAVDIIRGSRRCVVLTGAGISAPSGIPDFRSPDSGLWNLVNPFEVASLLAFRYHPERFFTWMRPFAERIVEAAPNPAHIGLARLEQAGYIKTVITQNIDRLHQRAGSADVVEVHGSLATMRCIRCYNRFDAEIYASDYLASGDIPHCPDCGGVLKPEVVLFGEQLPSEAWLRAVTLSRNCDLMIVVGTSLEVLPVAGLPMRALDNGAHLIIINHSTTYLDVRADVVFHQDLEQVLPLLADAVLDS